MRVPNPAQHCIGYRLNIIGVRVYRECCQLVARVGDEWMHIGLPRALPISLPDDMRSVGLDPMLLTIYQYEAEFPGSDLLDVLALRKTLDEALREDRGMMFRAG
jgi:hypothetical protein